MTKQICKHGDCMELIDTINEYHLLITSPPYNVGLDYGECKDDMELDGYISWLTNVFVSASEKLVSGGYICINIANTGKNPYVPKKDLLVTSLLKAWNLQYKGEIIWDKQNMTSGTAWGSWMSANKPSLRDSHEYILVFRKDGDRKGVSDITNKEFIKYTHSIWKITPDTENITKHPAPYPLELVKRLIKLYSFVGETVLDTFMGTGTTMKACRILNRNGIGFELNKEYVDIANTKSYAKIPTITSY